MFPKKGNRLHQSSQERLDGLDFNHAIAAALHVELGDTHRAVKTAMRWTGASERTVKNWLSGEYGPNGEHLVQLLRNSECVLQAILLLADRKGTVSGSTLIELRQHLTAAVRCLETYG